MEFIVDQIARYRRGESVALFWYFVLLNFWFGGLQFLSLKVGNNFPLVIISLSRLCLYSLLSDELWSQVVAPNSF